MLQTALLCTSAAFAQTETESAPPASAPIAAETEEDRPGATADGTPPLQKPKNEAQTEAPAQTEVSDEGAPDSALPAPPATTSPATSATPLENTPAANEAAPPAEPPPPQKDPYSEQPEASDAPKVLAKTPGAEEPVQWDDADEMIGIAAEGSIETCEALTFPLTFIPAIGSVIGSVVEWACLIPGAMAVDYTQAFHGDRASLLWQAGLGLVFAKLWREAWKYAGFAAAVGLIAAGVGVATALAFVAPYYIPVATAGIITAGGVGFLLWKRIRSGGSDLLFSSTYGFLTEEFKDETERKEAQGRSPVKYRMEGMNRAWALMATAAGAQPERELWYLIPVFGAWGKAMARADAVKAAMRRTTDDVLDEERIQTPEAYEAMDNVIDGFAYAEGGLMATAHVLLIGGGLLFTVGTGFAAVQFQGQNDLFNYALLAGTTGSIGIVVASSSLVALGAREIVKAFRPFAAPLAYGITEPEAATLDANAE